MLSLIGGFLILLVAAFFAVTALAIDSYSDVDGFGGALAFVGVVGIGIGALIIVFAILVHSYPHHHVVLGVLIVVLSIVSLASSGGLFLGFLLGVIGGILSITWRPNPPWVAHPGPYAPAYPGYATYPVYPAYPPPVYPAPAPYPAYPAFTPPAMAPPVPAAPAPAPPAAAGAPSQRTCVRCGLSNPGSMRYCPRCGTLLP